MSFNTSPKADAFGASWLGRWASRGGNVPIRWRLKVEEIDMAPSTYTKLA